MKCEDKFKFIEETLGEYDYLATKENILKVKTKSFDCRINLIRFDKNLFYSI